MYIRVTESFFGSCLFFVVSSALCQPQSTLTSKQNIQVKVIGAKTYSEKHIGGVGAVSGNRARIIKAYLQVPKGLTFATDNGDEGVDMDEGVFTLQDSQGENYIFGSQSGGFGTPCKNNVLGIYWICAYRPVPEKERKSLRLKTRLYFYKRSSPGKSVGSRWLDIPVKYYP